MKKSDYTVNQALLSMMNNKEDFESVAIVGRTAEGKIVRFLGGEMTNEKLIFMAHTLVVLADESD